MNEEVISIEYNILDQCYDNIDINEDHKSYFKK